MIHLSYHSKNRRRYRHLSGLSAQIARALVGVPTVEADESLPDIVPTLPTMLSSQPMLFVALVSLPRLFPTAQSSVVFGLVTGSPTTRPEVERTRR